MQRHMALRLVGEPHSADALGSYIGRRPFSQPSLFPLSLLSHLLSALIHLTNEPKCATLHAPTPPVKPISTSIQHNPTSHNFVNSRLIITQSILMLLRWHWQCRSVDHRICFSVYEGFVCPASPTFLAFHRVCVLDAALDEGISILRGQIDGLVSQFR